MGNMGLEMSSKGLEPCLAGRGDAVGLELQGRHLCPGEYLGDARECQTGEIDVVPKVGEAERDLTPSAANMSDAYPFHIRHTFVFVCREGQK